MSINKIINIHPSSFFPRQGLCGVVRGSTSEKRPIHVSERGRTKHFQMLKCFSGRMAYNWLRMGCVKSIYFDSHLNKTYYFKPCQTLKCAIIFCPPTKLTSTLLADIYIYQPILSFTSLQFNSNFNRPNWPICMTLVHLVWFNRGVC